MSLRLGFPQKLVTVIRHASSLVSSLAADRRPGSSSKWNSPNACLFASRRSKHAPCSGMEDRSLDQGSSLLLIAVDRALSMKYATIAIAASSTDWQAFAGSRRGDQGATGSDFTGGSIDTAGASGIEPPGPPYPLGAAVIARITVGSLMKR